MKLRVLIAVCAGLGVLGCQPTSQSPSAIYAVWDGTTQERVQLLARSLDYLPMTYKHSGCADRTLFLRAELAVRDIPSTAIFIHNENRGAIDSQFESDVPLQNWEDREVVRWRFHTGLAFEDEETGAIQVLDPARDFASVSLDEWYDTDFKQLEASGTYFTELRPESVDATSFPSPDAPPRFVSAQLAESTFVLSTYVWAEVFNFAGGVAAQRKIARRAEELVELLHKKALLQDTPDAKTWAQYRELLEAQNRQLRTGRLPGPDLFTRQSEDETLAPYFQRIIDATAEPPPVSF